MGLFSKFNKKADAVTSYSDFWNWFLKHEKDFFSTVKNQKKIEANFFDKLSPQLNQLHEGLFFLTGMVDDHTVELIITPDGNLKNIVFAEEIVAAAPQIKGWKFTALKPAFENDDMEIKMGDFVFGPSNLFFCPNTNPDYPDEINIIMVHDKYTPENESEIANGSFIFLDNYIGELNAVTLIDSITFGDKNQKELVPINKLSDYLTWRQKEFVEKYDGVKADVDNDNYSLMEGETNEGNKIIVTINTDLLNWDSKASHPWIVIISIEYDGNDNGGMPDSDTYQFLNELEDSIIAQLNPKEGNLNIGHQTGNNMREIYFACKDFRLPSKYMNDVVNQHSREINISFDIYKDKYWQSFNRFMPN